MNNITLITREQIFKLFTKSQEIELPFGDTMTENPYYYNGRTSQIEFLDKLYPLEELESEDKRYTNAKEELIQHTVHNDDYGYSWVFYDERFGLNKGKDNVLLDFLCAVFHPMNRDENVGWNRILLEVNKQLKNDGYELYVSSKISNQNVYNWRTLTKKEIESTTFLPFSQRSEDTVQLLNKLIPTISLHIRQGVVEVFNKYNTQEGFVDDTGYCYYAFIKDEVITKLSDFYRTKYFASSSEYQPTDNLDDFVVKNYKHCVFDAIEVFAQCTSNVGFTNDINELFRNYGLDYKLIDGKIGACKAVLPKKEYVSEKGLRDLIDEAVALNKGEDSFSKQTALEKLWDAFERLKTYYQPSKKDKSESAKRVVKEVSNGSEEFESLLDTEFKALSKIGNGYRIRHHETDKTEIIDDRHRDYLFFRCYALINLALKYLK